MNPQPLRRVRLTVHIASGVDNCQSGCRSHQQRRHVYRRLGLLATPLIQSSAGTGAVVASNFGGILTDWRQWRSARHRVRPGAHQRRRDGDARRQHRQNARRSVQFDQRRPDRPRGGPQCRRHRHQRPLAVERRRFHDRRERRHHRDPVGHPHLYGQYAAGRPQPRRRRAVERFGRQHVRPHHCRRSLDHRARRHRVDRRFG